MTVYLIQRTKVARILPNFAGEVFAEVGGFLAIQEVPQGPSELYDLLTEFNGQNVASAPKRD